MKAKKTKTAPDPMEVPEFLKRGTKAHAAMVAKAEELAKQGKGMLMAVSEDRDAPIHALAAELGFKRHQYKVSWFQDESWLRNQMDEKAKRDAKDAEKRAARDEQKAKLREEKALLGTGNRVRVAKAKRVPDDLPKGTIQWIGPNGKKEGTDAHARWEKLRAYDKRSTEAYALDGGNPTTLKNAVAMGRAKVLTDGDIAATKRTTAGGGGGDAPANTARSGAKNDKGAAVREAAVAPVRADKKSGGKAKKSGGKGAGKAGKQAVKKGGKR